MPTRRQLHRQWYLELRFPWMRRTDDPAYTTKIFENKTTFMKDLEKLKQQLKDYVKLKEVVANGEPAYHIVQANKTHSYKELSDDNYLIVSDSYLKQLNAHLQENEPPVKALATEKVGE